MDAVVLLARALDQAGDALDQVHPDDLGRPTPCTEWDVAALADHLVATPVDMLTMLQGGTPDWGAPPPHLRSGWGPAFRNHADDLIHRWHERVNEDPAADRTQAQMACAELAVHTWDLHTALGLSTDRLDPAVAEAGLAFMQANLTAEARGGAFGPEQPARDGAGAYERLAAYAGRALISA